ncbi:MAG: hypothetical protein ACJAZO_004833 [Myxococcota bacterium]|jgi:hypothetical protein
MKSASTSLTVTVICLVVVGMFPCLGWVQWFGAIVAAGAIITGGIGLLFDRDELGQSQGQLAHLLALVTGLLCGGLGILRCGLGGGIF